MRERIKFIDNDPLSIFIKPSTKYYNPKTRTAWHETVTMIYKFCFTIVLQVLFHYHHQFPEVRTHELLAKLGNVAFSLGGLNQNH
ncbi:hypothetical protein Ahy_B08g093675 [Arachis hypogaea]|uniref:Uncharacterized protein n=1 Tax=Arachis hypogaea TaxID=3818 RepID=A0A444Y6W1_ARAHY|nr:hypothetical protein Ahy_B08g093675 [Arachis hypogaea]